MKRDHKFIDEMVGVVARSKLKAGIAESDVVEFLFSQGLLLDSGHASHIMANALKKPQQHPQRQASDDGGLETSSSCELESERSDSTDSIGPSAELSTNIPIDIRPSLSSKIADPAWEAQQAIKRLFPGLLEHKRGDVLKVGDGIKLAGCCFWVCKQGKFHPGYNAPKSMLTRMNLCIHAKATRDQARTFQVKAVHRDFDGIRTRVTDASEPVKYGDTVEIRSGSLKKMVKFVCIGRSGPVRCLDYLYIVGVGSNLKTATSTWTFFPREKFGGIHPIVATTASTSNCLDISPLCFRLHFADASKEPVELEEETAAAEMKSTGATKKGSIRKSEKFSSMDLSVLVYNTWMMPPLNGVLNILHALGIGLAFQKGPRSKMIPRGILDSLEDLELLESSESLPDVVVLCEAFCAAARTRINAGLKRMQGLVFETPICGSGPFLQTHSITNSGLVILSRYPIVKSASSIFLTEWARDDGMANKGVIYIRVMKGGRPFNVVATHLQAWEYKAAIKAREDQMLHIRKFTQDMHLSDSEPLIVAGDLNVCRIRSQDQYERMLDILAVEDPHTVDPEVMRSARQLIALQEKKKANYYEMYAHDSNVAVQPATEVKKEVLEGDERLRKLFSFNSTSNNLAMGGPSAGGSCALLDYVLVSRLHKRPEYSVTTVLSNVRGTEGYKWKGKEYVDLSDHYPVLSRFTFEYGESEIEC